MEDCTYMTVGPSSSNRSSDAAAADAARQTLNDYNAQLHDWVRQVETLLHQIAQANRQVTLALPGGNCSISSNEARQISGSLHRVLGRASVAVGLRWGGAHVVPDFGSANQSTDFKDHFSQGFKVSFTLGKWREFGFGYERTAPLGGVGGPQWDSGSLLLGWRDVELSNEGLDWSIGGGVIFGASTYAGTGPIGCVVDR